MNTTTEYQSFLEAEIRKADKDIQDDLLALAAILLALYLKNPKNIGYTFRLPKSVNDLFAKLRKDILARFETYTQNANVIATAKNSKILGLTLETPNLKGWIARKIQQRTLSGRIWKYTQMYKMELEARIAMGIVNQESLPVVMKSIEKFLLNPYDNLNVRTRADYKARRLALKYNPGKGKYKSAYANMKRLIENEMMEAYRRSDYLIWSNSEQVMGVLVSLNPAHPKADMCDDLVGVYPKNFYFSGWHPACICIATPILKGQLISDIPSHAKSFMQVDKHVKWYGELPFYKNNVKFFK